MVDGDDLLCLVRTAYRGAVNAHDSNRITLKRVTNFRQLATTSESVGEEKPAFDPIPGVEAIAHTTEQYYSPSVLGKASKPKHLLSKLQPV